MDTEKLLERFRSLTASFTTTQLVSLAGAFVLVVGIITGSTWYLNKPTYALLFADLDAESAGQMVTRLKTLNVDYQLDQGGRGIRVPSDQVDELRLELTAGGLPSSGRVGFEIFDRTAFGATEFLEQVNYRRALEGEIARTIGTISEVSSARVHIAMGKDTLFGESRPAKASVVLKLRGNRGLSAAAVTGISNLVSASVEGLHPEAIVILDSLGRPLLRPDGEGDDPLGAQQMERQERLEREMSARVVALLEPIVGLDRVRANVALKLNPRTMEQTEELWDPNSVVRSRQTTADLANTGGLGAVAGARANTPPALMDNEGEGAAPPPGGPTSSRSAETTNYEISRTTRHVVQPPGEIARLSVAVLIDHDQAATRSEDGQIQVERSPRSAEEIRKIEGLVAAAVGLEPDRGDMLTVENVSFDEPFLDEGPAQNALERYAPQLWEGGRILGVALVGLFALLVFVRPLMRRAGFGPTPKDAKKKKKKDEEAEQQESALEPPALPPGPAVKTVAELENEIEAQLDAEANERLEGRRLPVLSRRASHVSLRDPENIARLLRGWMNESER